MTQHSSARAKTGLEDTGNPRFQRMFAATAICVLIALAYWNSLLNDFAFDDILIIRENPLIRGARQIPTLFITHYWEGGEVTGKVHGEALYRPLVLTTYALHYLTTGLEPWAFHLANVLIHLGVALTLYGVARRLALGWPGALAAAMIFAVHPLNTEAVTGIVGRAELMMALGTLLALYWDLVKNPPQDLHPRLSVASLGAFALALLSKEQAIMFPALLIVIDGMRTPGGLLQRGQIVWHARRRYLGYLLVSALYLAVRVAAIGLTLPHAADLGNPLKGIDDTLRIINAVKVAGIYLWLAVWPENLSADYSYNAIPLARSAFDPAALGSAAAWIILLGVGTVAFLKGRRPLAVGIAITVLFFLPASNIIVTIGTIMGERLFYLPLAGLCLVIGSAWNGLFEVLKRILQSRWRTAATAAAAILVLTPLTARTFARNRDWRNNETLYASIVRVRPDSAKGHFLMGLAHTERKDFSKALQEHQTALAIWPRYRYQLKFARAYAGLLLRLGRTDEAIAMIEDALREDPTVRDPWIHRLLAVCYEQKGAYALAAASIQRAVDIARDIQITSTDAIVEDYNQVARLYALQRENAASRRALEDAMEIVREDRVLTESQRGTMTAQLLGNLAFLEAQDGDYAAAEQNYLRVLELLESGTFAAPKHAHIARLREYGRLLTKMGRSQQAIAIKHKAAVLESQ